MWQLYFRQSRLSLLFHASLRCLYNVSEVNTFVHGVQCEYLQCVNFSSTNRSYSLCWRFQNFMSLIQQARLTMPLKSTRETIRLINNILFYMFIIFRPLDELHPGRKHNTVLARQSQVPHINLPDKCYYTSWAWRARAHWLIHISR